MSPSDVQQITEYVTEHEAHHRVMSFQDEYRMLLERYGIEYDERRVWD